VPYLLEQNCASCYSFSLSECARGLTCLGVYPLCFLILICNLPSLFSSTSYLGRV
jgi:hypothetical protein